MNTEQRDIRLFNTPIEFGLRSLFILNRLAPKSTDLQRLIYYDYLILHTSDIDPKQSSLHPSYPYRSAEILVKRERLRNGLLIMKSRQLVDIMFDDVGITYKANDLTSKFLQYFNSKYTERLESSVAWVIQKFNSYSDNDLDQYMNQNLKQWGSEFSKEAFIRESMNYE